MSNFKTYQEKIPKKKIKSDKYAVIVEPRSDHPLLEAVCRNIMYFLPEDWNLIIYSYNESIIKNKLTGIEFDFVKLDKNNITTHEYSQLLKNEIFWNFIPGEHILIFQSDSYMLKKLDQTYFDYISKFGMIGPVFRWLLNYEHDISTPESTFSINGGFNYRRKSFVLDAIKNVKESDIISYRKRKNLNTDAFLNVFGHFPEDIFFNHALYILNYPKPSYEDCIKFASQNMYEIQDILAVHGVYKNYELQMYWLKPSLIELYQEIKNKLQKHI
jgi:hypothetical protein